MTNALCIIDRCGNVGIFPWRSEDEHGNIIEGLACFEHDQTGTAPSAPDDATSAPDGGAADDVGQGAATLADVELDQVTFDETVTLGLAAMLLEHTAMAMQDEPDAIAQAMVSLAANTALTTEIASGLLLAMTWLAAAGHLTDEAILLGAELYERQADNSDEVDPDELDAALAEGDEWAQQLDDFGVDTNGAEHENDELAAAELDDTIPADGAQSDQSQEGA